MIILLSTSLLFLPFTAIITSNNNSASAQSESEIVTEPITDPNMVTYESERYLYQIRVNGYQICLHTVDNANALWTHYNVNFGTNIALINPISHCGEPPTPPTSPQPLDCNELQSCPTSGPTIPSRPTTPSGPTVYPVPRESPTPVDWNEELREECQLQRAIFGGIFCPFTRGAGPFGPAVGILCGGVSAYFYKECSIEYPPDLRRYGIPPDPENYRDPLPLIPPGGGGGRGAGGSLNYVPE